MPKLAPESAAKTILLSIRFSAEERALLDKAALQDRRAVSDYVRARALEAAASETKQEKPRIKRS